MGQTLEVKPGDTVTVEMRMVVPASNNSLHSFSNPLLKQVGVLQPIVKPVLGHVDLITGVIAPTDANYTMPVVAGSTPSGCWPKAARRAGAAG